MTIRDEQHAMIEARLRDLAQKGATSHEAADATGWGYPAIRRYAKRYGIEFKRVYRVIDEAAARSREARAQEFAARYVAGETLEVIGQSHGITRERVRQVLALQGISASDGGQAVTTAARAVSKRDRKEAICLAKWGCTRADYEELLTIGRTLTALGVKRERQPIGAFVRQKVNARIRGIGWDLTLWQWWTIWKESGRWDERGRGHGYVMCRKGDVGPYSVDNVLIAPQHFNSSFQIRKKSGLPTGVSEWRKGRFVAKIGVNGKNIHLGIFPNADLAHAAYLKALGEVAGPSKEVAGPSKEVA